MSKNAIIGIVAVLLLVVVGWFLTRPKQTMAPTEVTQTTQTSTSTQSANPDVTSEEMMAEKNAVEITVNGFSPNALTIKVGGSVSWTNSDSSNHTVNADPHPTHTLYPFLNVGVIKPGEEKSVTFEKAGKYTYHDHLNPSLTGSITVE